MREIARLMIVLTASAANVVRARRLASVERLVELAPAFRETRDGIAQPESPAILAIVTAFGPETGPDTPDRQFS
jgi:hypothetical protein